VCFSKIEFIDFQICPHCRKNAIAGLTHPGCRKVYGLDGLISVFIFDGVGRKLVHEFKFRRVTDLKDLLATLIVADLSKEWLRFDNYLFCPIPLSKSRENWRGFNQAQLISRELAQMLKIPVYEALVRSKNTRPQSQTKKEEKYKNISGVFVVSSQKRVEGTNILLFDDVFTTGSTLKEAAKVLKRGGANKVWALTLARSR